jgi:hypothetical protein
LLGVHWSGVHAVLKQAGDLSGRVIVTCSLPMNANDTALAIAHTSRLIRDVGFEPVHAGPLLRNSPHVARSQSTAPTYRARNARLIPF